MTRSTYDPLMSYVLRSGARPRLDAADFDEHEPRELIAEADTYEKARDDLDAQLAQLPEGWVLVGIDRYLEQTKS